MPPKRKTKQSVNAAKKDDGIHSSNERTTTKRMKKEMLDDQQDNVKESTAIKNEPEVDEVGDSKDVGNKRLRNSRKATSKRSNSKHVKKENDSEDMEDNSNGSIKDDTEEIQNEKSRGRKRGNAKESKQAIVKDGGDDENERKPQSKKKRTAKSTKSEEIDDNGTPDVKTVIIKGKAPVDSFCIQKLGKAHVYCEGNDVWDAMLNQTNLQHNNNKYYVIQLLEDDCSKVYSVWFRWGRVGKKGQNSLVECGTDVEKAKKVFQKSIFQDKTKNSWDERASFQKVAGKYDLLHMDYSMKPEEEEKTDSKLKNEPLKIPKSTLNERVQALIELICNVKAMEETVIEMKYDAKKAPLGKLTTNQIKAGYLALKEIEELIDNSTLGSKLVEACNKFYTRIPHDFGMRTPPLIRTREDILLKMQLLETLGDIEIAMKMINEANKLALENPIDRHYKCLNCGLTAIDKESEMFKVINEYLQNSHEKTHNLYTMELVDVFECCKETEDSQFTSNNNRMLLWHGSRLTNWVGILKQGLRIAPPEAPVTGYMFGKGVYFADRSSKSANYCFATRSHNIGLMLLCEVALGNCSELFQANYNADKLPKGKQSVKGLGEIVPDPNKVHTMADGTIIPLGKGCQAKLKKSTALNYNEYVVYNTSQIKMRYLVKVKFHFK